MTSPGIVAGLAAVLGVFATRAVALHARRTVATRVIVARLSHGSARRRPSGRVRDAWRSPPRSLVDQLRALQLPVDAELAWRWWRGAALAAGVSGAIVAGPVLAALGVVLVAASPVVVAAVLRTRSEARYETDLAAFLDAVARGVRSGGSIASAIDEAASSSRAAVGVDTQRVAVGIERGQPIESALEEWNRRRPRGSVRLAVGALGLAVETGGPPARVVEEVSNALRQRQQVEGEARALAAQARLSALVVGLAPIVFVAATCLTDPRNAHMLFRTSTGVACLAAGLSLDAIGAVWMHRMSESLSR